MNFKTKINFVYDAFKSIYMRPGPVESKITDLADDGYSISADFVENVDAVKINVERMEPNQYVVYRFKPCGGIISSEITGWPARLCYAMARRSFNRQR